VNLKLFDLIDDAAAYLNKNMPLYNTTAAYIVEQLYGILYAAPQIIGISSRIKTPDSLKEKIIRNQLYKKHRTAETLFAALSDTIGIRVECRFIQNEQEVLELVRSRFYREAEDGCFHNPMIPDLYLNLSQPQPQMQKNGLPIYRIDGYCLRDGHRINFELQIQAMVHLFWSDIEHKIVYKNNVYIPNDVFIKQLLASIHDNLTGVDNQLRLVYESLNHDSKVRAVSDHNMRTAIAKTISDLFCAKLEETLGFTVDFKRSCDIISDYVLQKNRHLSEDLFEFFLFDFTGKIKSISVRQIDFKSEIRFSDAFVLEEGFCRILGEKIYSLLNVDYDWHLFFRMLFEMEPGSDEDDFSLFFKVYKDRLSNEEIYEPLFGRFSREEVERIRKDLLETVAKSLVAIGDLRIVYDENIVATAENLAWFTRIIAENIVDMEAWDINAARYSGILMQRIITTISA